MKQPLLSDSLPLQQNSSSSSLIIYLYIGHFLARWGARMWEFSVGLYMIHIFPGSLLLTAVYGVVESASIALLGPLVGRLVNKLTYKQVLRLWLLTQNLSFIVAGATVTVLLLYADLRVTSSAKFISLVVLTNISGAIGILSTLAGTILIEKEWVVVISTGESSEALTKMNSVIRRIDLVCKLLAPVLSGFIISFVSLKDSAIAFTVWNILSVSVIYWLFISVYNGIPSLSENSLKRDARLLQNDSVDGLGNLEERLLSHEESNENLVERGWKHRFTKLPFIAEWTVYFQQDIVLPGMAVAVLYFTVLNFGTLMTATLEWEGIPAYVIGIMRGISATIGIAATLVYPVLHSHVATLRSGLWAIWMQYARFYIALGLGVLYGLGLYLTPLPEFAGLMFTLQSSLHGYFSLSVASVWIHNTYLAAWLLMGGVAASRLGLWMFDLSITQQMQDQVPDSDRMTVGGVQNSLQSILYLLTYVMGIIISNPQDFWMLTILSFFLVSLAAVLYTLHIYRVRKHLFHFEKMLSIFTG